MPLASYPLLAGFTNSPSTYLTAGITATDTTIPVNDLAMFPAAPNVALIGTGTDAETIYYAAKSAATGAGNLTSVTRAYAYTGVYGVAKAWLINEKIGRNYTSYDHLSLLTNITPIVPSGGDVRNISLTKDNNGVERKPVFEKFGNNTIAAYTLTGTPSIASGVCTLAANDKLIRTIDTGATTGKWDAIPQFTTAYFVDQSGNLYFGSTSYIAVIRKTGDAIWLQLTVNGSILIAATNTTATLADSTYGIVALTYDGTNYQMAWNGTNVGAATAGSAPTTPSLGFLATASGFVLNEFNYIPSTAYTEPFTADGETRYMQLVSTDLTIPATTGTWAAAAAGDVVVTTGSTLMTLASADDEAVCTPFRSYNFGSGEYEFSFDCNNDGGGGADETGYVFGYQDVLNHYRIFIHDSDGAGTAENLKIYKVVAGVATQLGTSADVTARYAKGTRVYVKLQWDAERGQMWAYLKDNTGGSSGLYPTTPDIADAFSAQYSSGKFGPWAAVTTVGAGNLNVDFYPWTARTKLEIGRTNVPATETNFYIRDEFTANDSGRWGGNTTKYTWGGAALTSAATTTDYIINLPMYMSDVDISLTVTFPTYAGSNKQRMNIWMVDRPTASGATLNGYRFQIWRSTTGAASEIYFSRFDAGTPSTIIAVTAQTFADATQYTMRMTRTGGVWVIYIDGVSKGTTTDATYIGLYPGIGVYNDVAVTTTINNLTISGTRYYMLPMLRGTPIGENAAGACTRVSDDCDWNSIAEYTIGGSASAFDTANGWLTLADATSIYPTAISMKEGHYAFLLKRSTGATDVFNCTIAGNAITTTAAGVTTIGGTAYTGTALTSPVWVEFYATGTQIAVYSAGVLIGTKTGLTLAYSNISMSRTTANIYVLGWHADAFDNGSAGGISVTIPGIHGGARYDTQEEAYFTWTNATQNGEALIQSRAKSPVPASASFEYYFINSTDSTAINWDGQSIAYLTPGTTYLDGVARALLRYQDIGDTLKISIRRKDYSGITYDNQPAVYTDLLAFVPVWGV